MIGDPPTSTADGIPGSLEGSPGLNLTLCSISTVSSLREQLERALMPGMHVPEPIDRLFTWIEKNEYFVDRGGRRVGFLFPESTLKSEWTETSRPGGTLIEFAAEGNEDLRFWFGHNDSEVLDRLCVFAKTGAEGSMCALWLDDEGNQRIVHMGSGSGSTMVCVLAEHPVDYRRLLVIGYDEICWGEDFSKAPNSELGASGVFVHPNTKYREWVAETFSVSIPSTGSEIVKHPLSMNNAASPDPFWLWVEQNAA